MPGFPISLPPLLASEKGSYLIMWGICTLQLASIIYFGTTSTATVLDDYEYPELREVQKRQMGKMVCYDLTEEDLGPLAIRKCQTKCQGKQRGTRRAVKTPRSRSFAISWSRTKPVPKCTVIKECKTIADKKLVRRKTKDVPIAPNQSFLITPNIEGTYPSSYECVWHACSSDKDKYYIELQQLDLQYSLKCKDDFFEIREGGYNGTVKAKLCKPDKTKFTISNNCIWLRFRSDSSKERSGIRGFFASFSTDGKAVRNKYGQGVNFTASNTTNVEVMRSMLLLDETDSSALETTQELLWSTIKYPTLMETVKQLVDLTQTNIQSATRVFEILNLCLPNPTSCLFGNINNAVNQCSHNKFSPQPTPGTDDITDGKTQNNRTNTFTEPSNNQTDLTSNITEGSGIPISE